MRAEELADEIKSLANSRTVSKLHQGNQFLLKY
jgi:hypothetical protein